MEQRRHLLDMETWNKTRKKNSCYYLETETVSFYVQEEYVHKSLLGQRIIMKGGG